MSYRFSLMALLMLLATACADRDVPSAPGNSSQAPLTTSAAQLPARRLARSFARALADSLRDWLDAYRFFDVALFTDDPAVLEFVWSIARPSPNPQPQRTRAS